MGPRSQMREGVCSIIGHPHQVIGFEVNERGYV